MDLQGIADAAVTLLVGYLKQVGGLVGDRAADSIAENAVPFASRLHLRLRRRLRGREADEIRLDDVEERPDDQTGQTELAATLRGLLAEDPGFAEEVTQLLKNAGYLPGTAGQHRPAGGGFGRRSDSRGR